MTWQGWAQIALFAALVTAAVRPLGGYMARVIDGGSTPLQRLFRPFETALYRLAGVDPTEEQTWPAYALGLLAFSLAGIVMLYALQRLQNLLPLNPQHFPPVPPDLALNTAVSFATNTSWQSYAGETTLSYLTQMAGITVQSFLSARRRHRRGHRPDPRLRAPLGGDHRQFLGRSDPRDALRAAADLRRRRAVPRLAGRAADARRLRRRPPRWRARRSFWRAGRWPRRRRSSC